MDPIESIQPIANEEPEVTPLTPEPPTPEAPPPPKKKKLSEDRLAKLSRARERASQVAKEKRERKTRPFSDDPIVVVEQDESDEDVFEAPPGVLFVRRKRVKKPEPPAAPTISPEMQILYASMFGSRSF